MRLSPLLMFAGVKAPHINGIMGFTNHCFAFSISDRKQYTSINGSNSNITNIYGVRKSLVSVRHLFLTLVVYTGMIKYYKVKNHFADDASLNFSSSIKRINEQANYNFEANSSA